MGMRLSNMLAGGGGEPGLSLTSEGMNHKQQLQILMYVHLGVAVSKVIIMGFMFGFGDLI